MSLRSKFINFASVIRRQWQRLMATQYSHPNSNHVNPSLLWEYDMSNFDWQRSKTLVVHRVVELGRPEDFYAAFDLYGGVECFCEVIKSIPYLSDIDMYFVCHYFNLQKEELLCYTRKQSRQVHLNC